MRNIVVAVGLAGLSNLRGDKDMNLYANEKYVTALRHTGQLVLSSQVRKDPIGFSLSVKSVVTLALFEVSLIQVPLAEYAPSRKVLTPHRSSAAKGRSSQPVRLGLIFRVPSLYSEPHYRFHMPQKEAPRAPSNYYSP